MYLIANNSKSSKNVITSLLKFFSSAYTYVAIILIVFVMCLVKNYRNVNSYLFLISSVLTLLCFKLLGKRKSISKIFLIVYYLVAMPFHLALSVLIPSYLVTTRFNALYDESLFLDNDLMLQYFTLGTLCFLIILFITHLFELNKPVKNQRKPVISRKLIGHVPCSLFFLLLVCVAQIAEMRVDASGYIDYAVRGLSLFFLAQVVASNSCYGKQIKLINIGYIIVGVVLYGLPSMLVGMRGDFVLAFFYSFLFVAIVNFKGAIDFVRRHLAIVIVLIIGFLFVFYIVSSAKFGSGADASDNVFYLLIRRMTGLFDGLTILKYLRTHEVNLDLKNFIGVALKEQKDHSTGYRANQIFTFFVQGYPTNDQTGSAAPAFTSALFYGNIGWLLIIVYIALLTGFISKKSSTYFKGLKIGTPDYSLRIKAFVSLFAIHNVILFYLMGGNYEQIKAFSPILVCYVLEKMLVYYQSKRKNRKHDSFENLCVQ